MHHDNPSTPTVDRVARVERAIEIYRSIAACQDHLARDSDVHALTAALMLPCYRTEFEKLASQLTPAEEGVLIAALADMARAGDAHSLPGIQA